MSKHTPLIAAAPELLAELKIILERGEAQRKAGDSWVTLSVHHDMERIRAIVAKAEGAK